MTREIGRSRLVLFGILAVGTILRFALLGRNSLWSDEAFTVWVVRHDWWSLLSTVRTDDLHPPLYYLLTKAWVRITGVGEAALRFPSASLSLLAVLLTYALMRRISSEAVSLLSALLVCVSPLQIMAGQEARMYALLGVLVLAAAHALCRLVERPTLGSASVYVALAFLMIVTQYFAFLVLLAHGLWVAVYERRHLDRWLVCIAIVAGLYTPWIPAVLHQMLDFHDKVALVHPSPKYLALGNLLALFAFGGSLFGTGGYFSPAAPIGVGQMVFLLPFLAVLWQGVSAFGSDPRRLALVGLPLLIPIGLTTALSFVGLTYWLRSFSFLLPFYAMLIAQGIAAVAGRLRFRWAAGVLTLGLVLFSVPQLARYYFEPASHPYQWRAAAHLVEHLGRPDDYILYVGHEPEMAFAYYFRPPHAIESHTLVPLKAEGSSPQFAQAAARTLAATHPRVWLILTVPLDPSSPPVRQRLMPALAAAYRLVGRYDFEGVWVYLLEVARA